MVCSEPIEGYEIQVMHVQQSVKNHFVIVLRVKKDCSGDRDDQQCKYLFLLKEQKDMQYVFNNSLSRGLVTTRDTVYFLSCNREKNQWKLKETVFSNYIKQSDDTSFYSQAEPARGSSSPEKSI